MKKQHTCPSCGHSWAPEAKAKTGVYTSTPMADRPGWHMWTSPSGKQSACTFPCHQSTLAAERTHQKRIARWARPLKGHDWLPAYLARATAINALVDAHNATKGPLDSSARPSDYVARFNSPWVAV